MSKKLNLAVSIFLGLICSALLLVVGVLAVKNYSPFFSINLTFNLSMATRIDLALNDGTFYTIYDNGPAPVEVTTASVSNTDVHTNTEGQITENIITLGSNFANVYSIDVFNFKVWNYNADGTLGATVSATANPQSDIISQASDPTSGLYGIPAYSGSASSAILDFSLTVLKTTAIQINLALVLTVAGS